MADPDIFFAGKGESASRNEAKAICLNCPVRKQCDEYAMETGELYGIWGGKVKTQYKKKGK